MVRPYTYSHLDSLNSYTHTNQPLAHPLYANFYELILKTDYWLTSKIHFSAQAIFAKYGEDEGNENWGGNPLLSYRSRMMDFNNVFAQGHPVDSQHYQFTASYQFFHNYFFEVNGIYHTEERESVDDSFSNFYLGTSLKINY